MISNTNDDVKNLKNIENQCIAQSEDRCTSKTIISTMIIHQGLQ